MGCKPADKSKQKHKKGLWSPDEDQKLRNYIVQHGHGCWSSVPINAGLKRNGKSCRLRWINYLRPGLKRGSFSLDEEEIILSLHSLLGNKWSQISQHLPGRTDNEIKNCWHSYLKKKVARIGETESRANMENGDSSSPNSLKSASQNSGLESFEQMEGSSLTDTDQSVPKMESGNDTQKSGLPKILFAEWLSLDQFNHGQEFAAPPKNNFGYNDSGFKDDFLEAFLLNEAAYDHNNNIQPVPNNSAVDMFRPQLKFEDQISESGFPDFFSGGFDINDDLMYI